MRKALISLHIAVLLAGFTGVLGKLITMNEVLIVFYRLLIAAVALWIIMTATKKIEPLKAASIMKIVGVGFISALHWVFFYASIKYSNVSVGLVCFSAVSFFTAVLEPVLMRKKPDLVELLFGLAAILGLYFIFHFDTQFKTGIILGIISSFLAALFPILLKSAMRHTNMQTVLTWQMTGGFVFVALLTPVYLHYMPVTDIVPSGTNFCWLLVLALLCSVVAFQLALNALKKLSAFTVSLSYGLEPLYGIIMAFVIFKENQVLSKGFYFGLAIICITLGLHTVLLKKKHTAAKAGLAQ